VTIKDECTLRFGPIEELVQSSARTTDGSIKILIAEVGGDRTRATEIHYDFQVPLAQSLLLHERLRRDKQLKSASEACIGEFVEASGRGCARHPSLTAAFHSSSCLPDDNSQIATLEGYRTMLEPPGTDGYDKWLFILTANDQILVASILSKRWIDDTFGKSLLSEVSWTIFGKLAAPARNVPQIPQLIPLHVWVY
jgi:hypothetical protein